MINVIQHVKSSRLFSPHASTFMATHTHKESKPLCFQSGNISASLSNSYWATPPPHYTLSLHPKTRGAHSLYEELTTPPLGLWQYSEARQYVTEQSKHQKKKKKETLKSNGSRFAAVRPLCPCQSSQSFIHFLLLVFDSETDKVEVDEDLLTFPCCSILKMQFFNYLHVVYVCISVFLSCLIQESVHTQY